MYRIAIGACFAFILGCSAQMVELEAPMTAVVGDDTLYRLELPITMNALHAKPVNLREGTRWQRIGTIDRGQVFDTKDQVVIVNSFNVHEAAIVINGTTAVGFYLKVAKTFVETDPVSINLVEME